MLVRIWCSWNFSYVKIVKLVTLEKVMAVSFFYFCFLFLFWQFLIKIYITQPWMGTLTTLGCLIWGKAQEL
jgi:hypothetical protein